MKRIIIFILLISSLGGYAQKELTYSYVDKNTYNYYTQGNWYPLILLGEDAIKNKIDYYYLNYRMGVAYYMKNNYLLSSHYFEKALMQNTSALKDTLFVRLLMNDYIFTNDRTKAEFLKEYHINAAVKNKIYTKKISQFYGEMGVSVADNITDKAFNERKFYAFKQIDQFKKLNYFNADLQGYFKPNVHYQFAFSGLKIERYKFFKDFPDTLEQNYTINQSYIYGGINYSLGNIYINPAINSPGYKSTEITIMGEDSLTYRNIYDTLNINRRNLVGALRIGMKYKKMQLGIVSSYSNLKGLNQFQLGAEFVFFPNGNLNSYMSTNLVGKWESGSAHLILRQTFGIQFTHILWGEMKLTIGDLTNFNADNGYYIYNTYDDLKSITDLKFIILINKYLEVNIVFQHLLKENYMLSYPSIYDKTIEYTNYYFQQINLIGGIKWKF